MDLQAIINKAQELKKEGNSQMALSAYNDVFDLLSKEAGEHARNTTGSQVDIGNTRALKPQFFGEAKKYLKRGNVAATIANNMGVIFAELKDYESAREFFQQSIDLTPDNIDYPDPKANLENLK